MLGFFATLFVVSESKKIQDPRSKAAEITEEVDITASESASPTQQISVSPTGSSSGTIVVMDLALHGLGKTGDSVNDSPTNTNPLHTDRTIFVELFDSQNQFVSSKSATVTYASDSGRFKGTIDFGNLASGGYTIKVKTNQFLKNLVPGIQMVQSGSSSALPVTPLIVGDVNNDNVINILDFNVIDGCFSDLLPAHNCTDDLKADADITDDGKVNQFDYNLFIREISAQSGR